MSDPFDASFDLDGETLNGPTTAVLEAIPYEERARRALLIIFGIMFVVLTALQVALGLTLDAEAYQAVSGPLGGANTVLAAALGAAALYYFTRKEP